MGFVEYFDTGGRSTGKFGVDGDEFFRYDGQGALLERRAPTAAERVDFPVATLPATPDITALANELTAQRARLDAAEDALDHLIVASLDADLGSL